MCLVTTTATIVLSAETHPSPSQARAKGGHPLSRKGLRSRLWRAEEGKKRRRRIPSSRRAVPTFAFSSLGASSGAFHAGVRAEMAPPGLRHPRQGCLEDARDRSSSSSSLDLTTHKQTTQVGPNARRLLPFDDPALLFFSPPRPLPFGPSVKDYAKEKERKRRDGCSKPAISEASEKPHDCVPYTVQRSSIAAWGDHFLGGRLEKLISVRFLLFYNWKHLLRILFC